MTDEHIKEWFYHTTTLEFRQDLKSYYDISESDLLSIIKEFGVEHILNKDLTFMISFRGHANDPNKKYYIDSIDIVLKQGSKIIDSKTLHKKIWKI